MAAYLDDGAARLARPDKVPALFSRSWFDWLKSAESETQARVALSASGSVRERFTSVFPSDPRLDAALALADGVLSGERPGLADVVERSLWALNDAISDRTRQANFCRSARKAASSGLAALECVALRAGLGILYWSESPGEAAASAVASALECGVLEDGSTEDGHVESLATVVRTEVAGWALAQCTRMGGSA